MLSKHNLRLDSLLFGETAGRIIVSVNGEGESALKALCETHRVPFTKLGTTGGTRVTVAVDGQPLLDANAVELLEIHSNALEKALG